ncbi:MAG TPA: tetratricopeptide repeat protein [Spirochaetota bacterium]|nr:tetratricopeptide repeat protein [Spirochaetota bacterium]HOD16012.1 tetratricopeptide repeat protein [Spirochaetota bacterium]HPG50829.1 tetratricopeptide repeat protein [Spirochaetota bacterium]HPN12239.1 tetratricopeptide repeat protein [Spirochaetota bacterium]HQL83499.1 tetratricopeptide repeat protein [Spirochaetota bacterium]
MNIIQRFRNILSGLSDPRKKSVISRRFVIALSVIYSSLILSVAISFYIIMHLNAATLKETLESNSRDIMLERTELIVSRVQSAGNPTITGITNELRAYNRNTGKLVAAFIFTKTSDENYFRLAESLLFHDDFRPGLERSAVVREEKETNYLKKGLLHGTVDPAIYSLGGYCWQNVYYPCALGNKKAVLQLMMSASTTRDTLENYTAETRDTRITIIAITAILVLAVILLTLIFLQNYSLLLGNLSQFMEKAAGGDLNVSLKQTGDDDLDQLAQSFNTLIEEMKDLSARPVAGPESAPAPAAAAVTVPEEKPAPAAPDAGSGAETPADETSALFTAAVALLKNNELDDAIAIFRTLTIVKPQGFGSWFNLGVAHAKKRDYEKAIRMFEEARRLNPVFDVTSQYIEKIKRLMGPDA